MFITTPKNFVLNYNQLQKYESQQLNTNQKNRGIRKTATYFKRSESKIIKQMQNNKIQFKRGNSLHTTKYQQNYSKVNQSDLLKSIRKASYHTTIIKQGSNQIKKTKQDNFFSFPTNNNKQNMEQKIQYIEQTKTQQVKTINKIIYNLNGKKYQQEVLNFKNYLIQQLQIKNKLNIFKQIKIQQNPHIPLLIFKYPDQVTNRFQTDVQTYRNFLQRKQKPTRQSVVQRYLYSNNLKAMIFRLFYRKSSRGQTMRPQFQGIKFQNEKPIFKQSTTSFSQPHKLTSTISLSQKRVGSIKFCKITNLRALQKFIIIAKQLKSLLQNTQKVMIDKLYIDFIVDVFQKPWIINIKYCQISPNSRIYLKPSQDQINSVGSCRLCGIISKKQDLKNSVSIRMLSQFISHLKKRTKNQDQHKIDFVNHININSKQNKKSIVCKMCYKIIIHQLQLIKMQKKLAQICNIIPQNTSQFIQIQPYHNNKNALNFGQYKQWRLLLYFEDVKNMNQINSNNHYKFSQKSQFSKYKKQNYNYNHTILKDNQNSPYILKYQLCPKITQNFKCRYQSQSNNNNLKINQVKMHYFYSQTQNIEDFINNTQIIVSLYSNESYKLDNKNLNSVSNQKQRIILDQQGNETLIASGSTHILSSFNLYKSSSSSLKGLMENGQRQTATVLLFFQNKKYCQLTLKVGLVYDGSYNVQNIPQKGQNNSDFSNFVKWNQIWFSKGIWNSNPLPKQWMEIFGSNYNYNKIHHSIRSSDKNIPNDQNNQEFFKKYYKIIIFNMNNIILIMNE